MSRKPYPRDRPKGPTRSQLKENQIVNVKLTLNVKWNGDILVNRFTFDVVDRKGNLVGRGDCWHSPTHKIARSWFEFEVAGICTECNDPAATPSSYRCDVHREEDF